MRHGIFPCGSNAFGCSVCLQRCINILMEHKCRPGSARRRQQCKPEGWGVVCGAEDAAGHH